MEATGIGSGDPESGVSAYADDVVFMPPGEPAINGKDGVRGWLPRRTSRSTSMSTTPSPTSNRSG